MILTMIILVTSSSVFLGFSIIELREYLKRRKALNCIKEALLKDISC